MLRNILRSNYFTTFGTSIGVQTLGLITAVIIARQLGPTGRGEIAAVLLWQQLLAYISTLGLMASITYYASLSETDPGKVLSNGIVAAVSLSFVFLALTYLLMPILLSKQSDAVVRLARLFLISLPISVTSLCVQEALRSQLKLSLFNTLRVIIPAGYFVGVLMITLVAELSVQRVVGLNLVLQVVNLLVAWVLMWWAGLRPTLHLDLTLMRRMVWYGLRGYPGILSSIVNVRLDQAVLAAMVSSEQLGLYAIAVSTANMASTLARSVGTVMMPSIARQATLQQQCAYFQRIFRGYWALNLLTKAVMLIVVPWAIPLVYGAAFKGAIVPGIVLIFGALFLDAKIVLGNGANALNAPEIISISESIANAITIGFLVLLVPTTGILGAAITSLLAYLVAFAYMLRIFLMRFEISTTELLRIDKPVASLWRHLQLRLAHE